jgi:outer membrane autotransporter protein
MAACAPLAFTNSAENVVCNPGAGESFSTLGGADTLVVNGGTVGTVSMGDQNDTATVTGGAITTLNQDGNRDTLSISGGSIGTLRQGSGEDVFVMTGGTAGSVFQNADLDLAYISGGTITGILDAADYVEFNAGTINQIELEVGNNTFNMWGAAVVTADVNSENGTDTYRLFGGNIGQTMSGVSISTGSNNDTMTIGGASSSIAASSNPAFDLARNGTQAGTDISGSIVMEGGSDSLTLNLGSIGGSIYMDGGLGETNALAADTFNDTVTLNGGTVTGSVIMDSTGMTGNDSATVNGATVSGGVDLGDGTNSFTITSGTVTAGIVAGSGVDTIQVSGGTVSGDISTNGGNDILNWTAGNLVSVHGGDGSDTVSVSAAGYTGSQLLDGGDDVATADGFTDTLNLNGLTVTANGGNLLNWELLNLNSSALTLSNNAIAVGTLAANAGSTLASTGALSVTGNLTTAAGGTWLAPTGGSVTGNLVNAGVADLRDGATGDSVAVAGNYTGGGVLGLDVDTAGNTADRLLISGNVLGAATSLAVNNLGLSGSYTGDGPGAGIALVEVGGSTDASDFSLAAGPVTAGGFLYDLSLESDGIFYLQSTVRGGAVAAATTGLLVGDMGQTFLGTRHERVGEQELAETSNIWGRAVGQFAEEGVSASGIGTIGHDSNVTGLQAGLDLVVHEASDGSRTRFGVYGGLSWISSDSATAGAGGASSSTSADGQVAALYASHDNAAGWYVDAVVQGAWLELNAIDPTGAALSTDAQGWSASVEMGSAMQLTQTSWFEPQVQVIYGRSRTAAARDSNSVLNEFSHDDMLLGRIGARLKSTQKLNDGEGGFVTGWMKANLWADAASDDQSVIMTSAAATTAVALQRKSACADVGMGLDIQANQWMTLFADSDVSFGIDQSYKAFAGKVGVRLAF